MFWVVINYFSRFTDIQELGGGLYGFIVILEIEKCRLFCSKFCLTDILHCNIEITIF